MTDTLESNQTDDETRIHFTSSEMACTYAYLRSIGAFMQLLLPKTTASSDNHFKECIKILQAKILTGAVNNWQDFQSVIKEQLPDRPQQVAKFCDIATKMQEQYSVFYKKNILSIQKYNQAAQAAQDDPEHGYIQDVEKLYNFFGTDKSTQCYGILTPTPKKQVDGYATGNAVLCFYDPQRTEENDNYLGDSPLLKRKISIPFHETTHILFGHSAIKQDLIHARGDGVRNLLTMLAQYFEKYPENKSAFSAQLPIAENSLLAIDEAIASCSSALVNNKYNIQQEKFYFNFEGANELAKAIFPVYTDYLCQNKKMDDQFFMQASYRFFYNTFIDTHQQELQQLNEAFIECKDELRQSQELADYNAGTMKTPDQTGTVIANAFQLKQNFDDYKSQNPTASDTEAKSQAVFEFLKHNGSCYTYQNDAKTNIFGNVTRELFYEYLFDQTQTNTNVFFQNMDVKMITLEPRFSADLQRNVSKLSAQNIEDFQNIPSTERLQILYERGLYHEMIHAVANTNDERKCDAYALLKTMRNHPEHAKIIFDIYSTQRSVIKHSLTSMLDAAAQNETKWQEEIAKGTMTYIMPQTYKKLKKFAENPSTIPATEGELLKTVWDLTSTPDFSEQELTSFKNLIRQMARQNNNSEPKVTEEDLKTNAVFHACMVQSGLLPDEPPKNTNFLYQRLISNVLDH